MLLWKATEQKHHPVILLLWEGEQGTGWVRGVRGTDFPHSPAHREVVAAQQIPRAALGQDPVKHFRMCWSHAEALSRIHGSSEPSQGTLPWVSSRSCAHTALGSRRGDLFPPSMGWSWLRALCKLSPGKAPRQGHGSGVAQRNDHGCSQDPGLKTGTKPCCPCNPPSTGRDGAKA